MDCLPELAHSEFQDLVRKLHYLLFSKILIKQATAEFITVFHKFAFLPGWGQI